MTTVTRKVSLLWGIGLALVGAVVATAALAAQGPSAKDQLLLTRACQKCDLSGAVLSGLDLKGVDLTGANLAGASLYKSDLTNANLDGADLSKAVLTFADLSNTNIGAANLTGANLSGAKGAALAAATTTDTTICPDGQAGPCR